MGEAEIAPKGMVNMIAQLADLALLATGLPLSLAFAGGGIGGTAGLLTRKPALRLARRARDGAARGAGVGLVSGAILTLASLLLSVAGVAIGSYLPL